MQECAPQLLELLSSLDGRPEICYALNSRGNLVYCNRSWDHFAIDNDGAACLTLKVLGKNIWHVLPSELKEFFEKGFNAARLLGYWEHDFQCPSPAEFRTLSYACAPPGGWRFVNTQCVITFAAFKRNPRRP
jgi:hypothetical protein